MCFGLRSLFPSLLAVCACWGSAAGQTAAAPAQPPPYSQPATQPLPESNGGYGDNLRSRRQGYWCFLKTIAMEQQGIEMEATEGGARHHVRVIWTRILGITGDQEVEMRLIGAEEWGRIQRLHEEDEPFGEQPRREPSPEVVARRAALARQEPGIIDEAMVRLREELGQESFDRLDAWVYGTFAFPAAVSGRPPSPKADGPAGAAPAVRP